MQLGQTIQKIRKENHLTQEEFAEIFHVTRQTVSNWENEKSYPDLLTLVAISDNYFRCSFGCHRSDRNRLVFSVESL